MTEDALMEKIRDLLAARGLEAFHCHDSRRSWGPGFPDLLIVGKRAVLYREVKGTNGLLRPAQRRWGRILMNAGQDWKVWGPADLARGHIEQELDAVSGA